MIIDKKFRMKNITETMSFSAYHELIRNKSDLTEIGMFNDLDIALEVLNQVEKNPGKYGLNKDIKTQIIRIVDESLQKGFLPSDDAIDGYILLAKKYNI
tara:strand:+ start:34 stop:330 length:297 start_codon:yes stop_codon:yes gene_type:complete